MKMKNTICFIFSILIISQAFGQEKISGVGIFKIKTPISLFWNYVSDRRIKKVHIVSSFDDELKYWGNNDIVEFKNNPAGNYQFFDIIHSCADVRIFEIKGYKVADLKIDYLDLLYYKDSLVQVSPYYSEALVNAFTLKYGPPSIDSMPITQMTCVYKLTGREVKHQGYIKNSIWGDDEIQTVYQDKYYFTSDCEDHFKSSIKISLISAMKQIYSCDEKADENIKAKNTEAKKQKLSDL